MKKSNKLKAITLILVIILITILAFLGVYNITTINGNNLVKDYSVGMDLKGKNIVRLKVDDTVNEVTYDSEGNVVEEQGDEGEYTVVEEPVNAPEVLTKENYEKSLKIIEDRLDHMDAQEYKLRFDEETGTIELEMIDDDLTDYIISAISAKGDFKMIDADTEEVLLDSSSVKESGVVYSSTDSSSATTYLDIEFNKDGKKKLEDISKTYITTTEQVTNEEGETEDTTVEKKVSIKIDDNTIISTTFGEPLTNGHIYISVGQATSNSEELQTYALQASAYAAMIESDTIPIGYTIEQSKYIVTNTDKNIIPTVSIIVLIIEVIVFIIIFKSKGIIASILQIGYVALLLLILKYTNVYITLEGLFAIVLIGILNMVFICKALKNMQTNGNVAKAVNEALVKFINVSIPVLIVAIIFCFANWLEINSFGMVMFWGYVVSILYNIVFTKIILKNIYEK